MIGGDQQTAGNTGGGKKGEIVPDRIEKGFAGDKRYHKLRPLRRCGPIARQFIAYCLKPAGEGAGGGGKKRVAVATARPIKGGPWEPRGKVRRS